MGRAAPRREGALAFAAVVASSATASCSLALPIHERSGETSPYASAVMSDHPSLYLRLDEATGPAAHDAAGTDSGVFSATGITYGQPGAIAGDPDTAVAFDGTGGVAMPSGLDFTGKAPFTVEFWAKQARYIEYGETIDNAHYDPTRDGWTVRSGDDKLGLERWFDGGLGAAVYTAMPLGLGTYHHIVTTYDGVEMIIYIDAVVMAGPVQVPGVANGNTMPWTIGRQNCNCTSEAYAGLLDEIAIYPFALSAARVLAHYQIGTGQP